MKHELKVDACTTTLSIRRQKACGRLCATCFSAKFFCIKYDAVGFIGLNVVGKLLKTPETGRKNKPHKKRFLAIGS